MARLGRAVRDRYRAQGAPGIRIRTVNVFGWQFLGGSLGDGEQEKRVDAWARKQNSHQAPLPSQGQAGQAQKTQRNVWTEFTKFTE